MEEILDFMKKRLDKEHYERFAYAFEAGKRIRPRMMKNVCEYIGKEFGPLLAAASAIEIMHCVSLIHDDIIDKTETRRNKKAFHKKYGTDSAVLFGDLLATISVEILSEKYSREIYLEFIKTFKNMIEGQIMELENKVIDKESYFEYIEKKTVSLFILCAKIPMMHYGIEDEGIIEFAREFGVLFQIANDLSGDKGNEKSILDFMSRENVLQLAKTKMERLSESEIKDPENIMFVFGNLF